MEEKVVIGNEIGLHARLAAKFISISNKYDTDILVEKEGKEYNGKSLISIMSMGAIKGETITIKAEGDDGEAAIQDLAELLSKDNN